MGQFCLVKWTGSFRKIPISHGTLHPSLREFLPGQLDRYQIPLRSSIATLRNMKGLYISKYVRIFLRFDGLHILRNRVLFDRMACNTRRIQNVPKNGTSSRNGDRSRKSIRLQLDRVLGMLVGGSIGRGVISRWDFFGVTHSYRGSRLRL